MILVKSVDYTGIGGVNFAFIDNNLQQAGNKQV
jgi:hypothetical protein